MSKAACDCMQDTSMRERRQKCASAALARQSFGSHTRGIEDRLPLLRAPALKRREKPNREGEQHEGPQSADRDVFRIAHAASISLLALVTRVVDVGRQGGAKGSNRAQSKSEAALTAKARAQVRAFFVRSSAASRPSNTGLPRLKSCIYPRNHSLWSKDSP